MDKLKTGTDHIEIQFEQRLRFRGASAAGAVHVLRSLRATDPSAPVSGNRNKQSKTSVSQTAERTSVVKKIFHAVLFESRHLTRSVGSP
tara:strand:- start:7774 stop:8040 length:267 start_codon:yes stop_codon:yes gene_type:complete